MSVDLVQGVVWVLDGCKVMEVVVGVMVQLDGWYLFV